VASADVVPPASDLAATGGDDVVSVPKLIRAPVNETDVTMSADHPIGPAATPSPRAPHPTPEPTPVQVTTNAPAAVDDSVVLIGVVLVFMLGVLCVVLGAGRRSGRR
jgi:hypothetical protein